jgi:hypothetical protein
MVLTRSRISSVIALAFVAWCPLGASGAEPAGEPPMPVGGLLVHLGCGSGERLISFAAQGCWLLHGLDADEAKVARARTLIQSKGLAGIASVEHWTGSKLPYADNLVNVLIADDPGRIQKAEILRVLAPGGFAKIKGETVRKPWPKEMDGWTHVRHGADGNPVEKTLVVPREAATISDVWHVIGLKGTGSDTYTLTDVFVPEDRAIAHHALDPAERREPGPLYSFTIYQLFGSTFPAVALGIARTTLDAFVALAKTKTPIATSALLRDYAVIQSQVGVAEAQLAAARAFFLQAWTETWQAAQSGTMSIDQRVRLRMASIHASHQAKQVVDTAYAAAGATAIFESNPFERRFRDMHAVSQQLQSHFAIFEGIGRHFLGLPLNARLI